MHALIICKSTDKTEQNHDSPQTPARDLTGATILSKHSKPVSKKKHACNKKQGERVVSLTLVPRGVEQAECRSVHHCVWRARRWERLGWGRENANEVRKITVTTVQHSGRRSTRKWVRHLFTIYKSTDK